MKQWWPRLLFAVILAAAAALRFCGLKWGLPNALHSYSYHPDEFLTIGAAVITLSALLPRFYNYPSLYLYLGAAAIAVGAGYGLTNDAAGPYLCARVVTALMGVGAVALTYWACRSVFQTRPAGLLAAFILCVAPLHVQHSHFATVDVPSTLFVAACLGFAGLVLKRGSWRDYILCGVMAGLAAGTKYNAGLVILSLIAAHFLGGKDRSVGFRRLLAGLGCAIAAFIISTPGVIFQWSAFTHGFLYEVVHSRTGHGLVFAGTGNGFVYTFTHSLWYGLGPALAILFGIAAIYGLARLDRRALTILAFALPYYALISLSQVRFARYSLPLFPAAALLIAWMACDLWSRFPKGVKWAWAGLLTVVLAGTLLYTIALDRLFVMPDPRDRAARWIFANIPKSSAIGVVEVPWFYSPPYSKTIGFGALQQRKDAMASSDYILPPSEYDQREFPRWWIVSDYEVDDAARIIRIPLAVTTANLDDCLRINGIAFVLEKYYRRTRSFSDPLSALGISFGSTRSLPHDMRYPAPTIWIYESKKQ